MHTVRIVNEARATLVGDFVEVASTGFRRLVGLLGRRGLVTGGGLWIRPSSGIHTVGMLFPIDVIGLDKTFRVIKLWSNLAPFRITPLHRAMHSVIELPSGRIAETEIRIGDSLRIG